ncbi:inositol monophosphatase [Paraphaeosphaeria sporulosa]|uniref:Inositol-1-monophosphatase n=1 Tax=Paraphaeosphaeria sporulosa TaxID=1460663 RepID=A0A177CKD5_9PLEO|nr:inositol monophosphatase [Paraphaeosphaeria sporulosa]OAG07994.1 inositol monophosphatase [Paraphaeosphaeria sporulosa]
MADINLQEVHDFMIEIARKVGERITSATPSTGAAGSKKNSVDLVTETDQAVEKIISTSLHEKYPSFSFMGEETYKPGDKLTDAPTFILDPIDGTTNFVHRHPYVAISLGLAINQIPTIGIVYNPFTQTLYSGIKGHGSYLTQYLLTPQEKKQRLPLYPPTPLETLNTCLVAVEWGSDRSDNDFRVKSSTFARLAAADGGMVHGLRSLGSAALNLCAVAAGEIDVYWEAGCWAWDVCAGWVVLGEAGGRVVDANPGNWEPRVDERRYLAVRGGEGQEGLIEEFWGLVDGRFEVGV